jgi:hypothetical protein
MIMGLDVSENMLVLFEEIKAVLEPSSKLKTELQAEGLVATDFVFK